MSPIDANGHLLPASPAPSDRANERSPWTLWRSMAAVAAVAILLGVVRPLYLVSDATFDGPYTRAFQARYFHMAREARLVGRPEADIVAVLGPPTSVFEFQEFHRAAPTRVYRYSPSRVHVGSFQVLCDVGVVSEIRQEPSNPE